MNRKGVFITLEGIDFSGKSTQAEMLAARLTKAKREPLLLREPGGTPLSERIRNILLNRGEVKIAPRAELLLFLAARAQLVEDVISPQVESGRIIICDRFYDSTYAYQGFARGLHLDTVIRMNTFATSGLVPDLTLLYDLSVDAAQRRGSGMLPAHDRLEKEKTDFHNEVRKGYLALAENEPNRVKVVDADKTPEEVFENTWELVSRFLKEHKVDPQA